MNNKKVNLFIPSAGLGTRLMPLTAELPKALVHVNGKPMIEHVLQQTKSDYVDKTIVNVHHHSQKLINYLQTYHKDIIISDETQCLLNTGGGLKKALELLDDDKVLVVHNVDIETNYHIDNLIEIALTRCDSMGCLIVSDRESSRKLLFDENMKLCGWHNCKTDDWIFSTERKKYKYELAFSGIYAVNQDIRGYLSNVEESSFELIPTLLKIAEKETFVGINVSGFYFNDLGKYKPQLLQQK